MRMRRLFAISLILFVAACDSAQRAVAPESVGTMSEAAAVQQSKIGPGVAEALREEGRARVMIALASDEEVMELSSAALEAEVKRVQAEVLANLDSRGFHLQMPPKEDPSGWLDLPAKPPLA